MRPPPSGPDHDAALSRRLALLGQELAAVRPRPDADPGVGRPWWDEHTRLAEATRVVDAPTPGRHAARSPGRSPAAGDDRALGGSAPPPAGPGAELGGRGRLHLGPAQLAVVAVVVMMALGVTCWWLARGRPSDAVELQAAPAAGLATPAGAGGPGVDASPAGEARSRAQTSGAQTAGAQTPGAETSAAGTSAAGASAAPTGTVTVDVSGRVRHPGVQVLPSGARVDDALTAAGGARPGVDLTSLNLAQVLVDGQQVLVGASPGGTSSVSGTDPGSASVSGAGSSGTTGATPVQVVDLNTASAEQLDTLPDVGPVTAQSILSWRQAHGRFSSVDELLEVDGIGEVTLGKIAPYVTV